MDIKREGEPKQKENKKKNSTVHKASKSQAATECPLQRSEDCTSCHLSVRLTQERKEEKKRSKSSGAHATFCGLDQFRCKRRVPIRQVSSRQRNKERQKKEKQARRKE